MSCQSINSRCHVSAPSPTLSPTDPVPRGLLTLCPAPTDPVGLDSPPPSPHPALALSRALAHAHLFSGALSLAFFLSLALLPWQRCARGCVHRTAHSTQHTAARHASHAVQDRTLSHNPSRMLTMSTPPDILASPCISVSWVTHKQSQKARTTARDDHSTNRSVHFGRFQAWPWPVQHTHAHGHAHGHGHAHAHAHESAAGTAHATVSCLSVYVSCLRGSCLNVQVASGKCQCASSVPFLPSTPKEARALAYTLAY